MLPHVSWIVDEQDPLPALPPLPVIMQPPSDGAGTAASSGPPPGEFTWQLQSVPAWSKHSVIDPPAMLPDMSPGPKHEKGVPPRFTQPIACTIELLQPQSCAHIANAVEQPFWTHPQQVSNDGAIAVSSKLGEHGPVTPEEPPALDATPLDPTPLDPTPLDPTPLEATPLEPIPPEETPDEEPPAVMAPEEAEAP